MSKHHFTQIGTTSDWAHSGRHRHHSHSGRRSSHKRRSKRQEQIRRAKLIFGVLGGLGLLGGAAAAFVIHFTLGKMMIGASVGLIGGLTVGLLFDR